MGVRGCELPVVAQSGRIVRLREGQRLSAVVGDPVVGLHVHWDGQRSRPCVDALGDDACPFCAKGDAPQFQAFLPVRWDVVDEGVAKEATGVMMLGARPLAAAGLSSLNELVGRECVFQRPRKKRFVEIQLGLFLGAPFAFPTCEVITTLMGAGRFWVTGGKDPFECLLRACARLYSVNGRG
jgi:hypothetical protein